MNREAIASAILTQNAERQSAEKLYWSVLLDEGRTGSKDKAAFNDALAVLGLTPADAQRDLEAIDRSKQLAGAAADHTEARTALEAAEAAFKLWWNETRPVLQAEIDKRHEELYQARYPAKARMDAALMALHQLRSHRAANPRTASFMATDPDSSPKEIRLSNGMVPGSVR